MTTQEATKQRTYGIPVFDKGVAYGISWHLTGDEEYRLPTAAHIVDFIKGNFLEPHDEGYLDLERLTDNAGFLVGWIIGEFVCSKQ
jgi:hypothetical protein